MDYNIVFRKFKILFADYGIAAQYHQYGSTPKEALITLGFALNGDDNRRRPIVFPAFWSGPKVYLGHFASDDDSLSSFECCVNLLGIISSQKSVDRVGAWTTEIVNSFRARFGPVQAVRPM